MKSITRVLLFLLFSLFFSQISSQSSYRFKAVGSNDSGGAGFKTISTNSLLLASNNTTNTTAGSVGSELFSTSTAAGGTETIVLKADGVHATSFDVNDIQILNFIGTGTGAADYTANTKIVFKNSSGTVIRTMTLNGTKSLPDRNTKTSVGAFFDNNNTLPVTGVSQIEFTINPSTVSVDAFTIRDISLSNVVTGSVPTGAYSFDFNSLSIPSDGILGKAVSFGPLSITTDSAQDNDLISYRTGVGASGTGTLYDNNQDIGGIKMWKVTRHGGGEFALTSIYIQEASVGASTTGTMKAFKDGSQVGSTVNVTFNGNQVLSGNSDFQDIDEFRIEAADINNFVDNLVFNIPSAADTTPPVFENSTPSQSSVAQTSFTLGTDIDEAGTIYYVVVADGASAPSSAEVKAGTASGGGSAVTSGNAAVSTGGFTNNFSVTGLTAGTAYDVYVVAEDDEGSPNIQTSPSSIEVTTSAPISASINDPSVAEGALGSTTLQFTVSLSTAAPSGGATIDFATSNGTALAGTDYTATTGMLSFSAGETSKTIDVTVSGDATVENDETLTITLSNATGTSVVIGDSTGTGTITNDDTAIVTIANVVVNENAGTATVTLALDNAVDGGFSVDVSSADNTATTADGDYIAVVAQTMTFTGTASETETFTITIGGDTKVEIDEIIDVFMNNLVVSTVSSSDISITDTATVTITNDDQATVTIANVSGNEDGGAITVTVIVDNAVDGGFDVNVSTADNTATVADSDYTPVSAQTLTFSGTAGQSRTFTVTPTADITAEPDENLIIGMTGLSPVTVSSSDIDITDGALVTILNDDSISASINDPSVAEGASGSTTLQFTVTLDAPAPLGGATIDFATSNGTATAGTDYTATSGTVSFSAGETSKTIDVTVAGDATVENDETLTITLSNPTGTSVIISDATGTGTITNDDTATVTIANVVVNENAGTATVTLALDNAVDGGFSVDVNTADNTATTADGDYIAVTSGTETFAGTTSETETFTITIGGDTKVEIDEIIDIFMNNLVVPTVSSSDISITDTATVTITNDDQATVTIANVSGNEDDGAITVTVIVDTAVDGGFDVNVSTADNTATTADSDYTPVVAQTLTFSGMAGESETFTITPTADATSEADENLIIGMVGLSPATVSSSDIDITDGAILTILNDDDISASINDPSVAEGASGSTTLQFTVTLDSPAPSGGATIDYATSDGTATAGSDYTTASGTVSFLAGETSKTIDITVAGENMVEVDETLTVTLSNPTGTAVIISDTTGTGTITNDDTTTVTIADSSANENAGTQTITATLSNPVQGGFALDVFTTDGTATVADSDYSSTAGSTLTFAGTAGETQTLNLGGLGDTKVEADETFTISMTNVGFTSVDTNDIDVTDTATYTILNDDTAKVTMDEVSVNEDTGIATITLTLDNEVDGGFSVEVSTLDGTATVADPDYAGINAGLENFAGNAGETQTIDVTIGIDNKVEADEVLSLVMSNLLSGTVSASDIDITDTGSVTILNDDNASLAIDNVSRAENADGVTSAFTFTVTLTGNVDTAFSVDYATTNITAIGGVDYVDGSGTLNFAGTNAETQQLTVTVNGDEVVEQDELFAVVLSNLQASGRSITLPSQGVGTIENDDFATVTIDNVTGNEDDGAITLTLTSDKQVDGGFSVDVNTADGTATIADSDYTGITSQTINFAGAAGETQTFTVTPTVDNKVEANEIFAISMNNLVPTVSIFTTTEIDISDGAAVTILNDDVAAVTIEDVFGNEDDGSITVTATLDNAVQGGFTVDVSTADGTATTADSDYGAVTSQTLTFTGTTGETQTFTITPTADNKLEADETFAITQSNLTGTSLSADIDITDGATGTIINDDIASVTIADISANEDDGSITVTATLDNPVQGGFSVDVSSADGTATIADSDYTAVTSETLTFVGTAGETQTFTVTLTSDTKLEADETLTIVQSNLSATTLGVVITDGATVTINNDDSAAVTIEDISANEDDGVITVTATLDNPVQGGFTVDVNTLDATATVADSDYTAVIGQILTFVGTAGETQTFTVTPTADNKVEADEIVTIGMTTVDNTPSFDNISITDLGSITILNDDATQVTFSGDISAIESDGVANLIATLSNPVQGGFALNITTADGTAIATSDYTSFADAAGATFIGTAGETQTIAIPITDDMIGESTEDFTVSLSSVSGTTLGASIDFSDTALITIIDDDAPVITMVSVPADGNYAIGDNLDFTVTFTNPATVNGSPSIPVTIGSTTVQAVVNGSFTNSLTADFRYTIVEGNEDLDGIAVGTDINLNGGTILGASNIPAILSLNNVASTVNINVDGIKPTVVVSSIVPDPTNVAFDVTITFSEDVTGFDITDIDVGNGVASNLTGSGAVYTATITPTSDGGVIVIVFDDLVVDVVGNGNVVSNEFFVEYDATNPTAVMRTTAPDPTNSPFTVDIVFDEDVFGFEMTDLVVTNGTPSAFTGSATTYSVLITPTASEDVIVEIPAGVTQDLATNPNDTASFTVEFDNIPPNPPQITHISDYTCSTDVSQTSDNTLEISGTAERGSTVEVFIEGISVGTTISDINTGFFTFDHTGTVLADGTYAITAQATDIAMNTGDLSNPFAIIINTVDSDGDGNPDFCDDDDNGDGVDDVDQDCDNDGIIDSLDTDNSSCFEAITLVKSYGFSPNGDGVNDGWVIEGITAYPNSLVQVFNRSGKQVFKKKGYQNDWDGISNQISNSGANGKLPVGPYLFIIDLGDGSQPTRGWLYINY